MFEFSGEKPDPADYFKSSSCPKISSSLTHKQNVTVGSTTITMDTTTPSDNQRCNIESVASENLDPSQSMTPQYVSVIMAPSGGSSRSSAIEMSGVGFTSQPSSVSIVGEKRIRQRVGRNLLGSTQSASPLTPRYDYHSESYGAKCNCELVLVKKGEVVVLLKLENCEHKKCLWNVNCVVTNHVQHHFALFCEKFSRCISG